MIFAGPVTYVDTHTATYTHTHTYTHNTYLHLSTRGCYITDGICLVFPPLDYLAHCLRPSVSTVEWSPTDCSTCTCSSRNCLHQQQSTLGEDTHIHTHMHKYVCIRIHTHTHTRTLTHTHTHTHTDTHAQAHTHTHTHTDIHTHTYLHVHLCIQYYTCIS